MIDIWREKQPIRFGSIDPSDRLTLWSIFDFFQEAAISHAESLGVGREAMRSLGQAWILSRLSLYVERRPAYAETIEVSTWPRKWDRLFALRDYCIRDAQDQALVRGRASWLVLDIEKRRPLRAQAVMENLPPNEGVDALGANPAALEGWEGLEKQGERTALYSDIDYFGHTNNARYIQWIQDAADMKILTGSDQIRFDINYLHEVLPGDKIEIWMAPLSDEAWGHGSYADPQAQAKDFPSLPGPGFAIEGRRSGGEGEVQAVFRAQLRLGSSK